MAVIFYRANIERRLPKLETSDINTALRGNIITKDGFSITGSQKLYKVMIDTRNIDPDKNDLFIKLYCIYSGDDIKRVTKIINSQKGAVTLSYKIDAKGAAYLQELSKKLYRKKIFIPYEDPNTGAAILRNMSIIESGESRQYVAADALTPMIGYVKKVEKDGITKTEGVKGVEKAYEYYISSIQDAKLLGPKDIGNNIILTSDSNLANRVDGYDIILNASLKLQTRLEQIIDEKKEFLNAKEIIVGIMDSKTGGLLALASTSRYSPSNIRKQDYKSLNSSATEYAYEVGSVFKPFIFALLLANEKINPLERINTYNGVYQLGKRTIKDVAGFNLAGILIASEGNLALITQITLKLLPKPKFKRTAYGVFTSINDAMNAVYKTFLAGIVPVSMEFLDNLSIRAVENKFHKGLPIDAGAILITDVDGSVENALENDLKAIEKVFKENGAIEYKTAANEHESAEIWFARRNCSQAITCYGTLKLNEDITVPRSKLPDLLKKIAEISAKFNVTTPCFGHTGDGNVHTNVMVDKNDPDAIKRGYQAIEEIFKATIELDGTLSGEHGIGIAKAPFMHLAFSDAEMRIFREIKKAFDPNNILNPHKMGL